MAGRPRDFARPWDGCAPHFAARKADIFFEPGEDRTMRNLLCAIAALAVALVLVTASAQADDAKDSKAAQATQQAAKDPNYRWHNGQWWYWMPKQKNWMVWNGSNWTPYATARSTDGSVRSYSYQGEANQNGAVQRLFGTPLTNVPNNVTNNQIIGSYGFRSAGSKALGRY
jgi:hypothetical protein